MAGLTSDIERFLKAMLEESTDGMLEIGRNDLAMQVVSVGFVIGVIQDSCETALNSSTDVLFTAVAEYATNRKLRP